MFAKALVVLAATSSVFSTVFVTSPTASTTCQGGSQCNIAWRDDGNAPSLEDFGEARISIYAGNAQQQTLLQPITTDTNVATTATIVFNIDPNIGPNGDEYFIRFESLSARDPETPAFPALAFSSRFTLTNMSGEFNASVQAQIDGLTSAPLPGPTRTATTTGTSTRITTSTSRTSTGTPTSTVGAASNDTNAAFPILVPNGAAVAGFAGVAAAMLGLAL